MSISKSVGKSTLTLAICAAVGSMGAAGVVQAADNPFGLTDLSSGYMVADSHGGKCGGDMKKSEGKCGGSGKCGGDMKKGEGKCGGDMKKGEGKCGGDMKEQAKDMANDAVDKMKSGKCGTGKCGGK